MNKGILSLILCTLALQTNAQTDNNATTEKSNFVCAAMNIDGLPDSIVVSLSGYSQTFKLNDNGPGANGTLTISQMIATNEWDIVGISEDFNYNDELMSELKEYSAGTFKGKIDVTSYALSRYLNGQHAFDTDGLNLIWKNDINVSNETITPWSTYYGYTEDGADGLITKGFRYYTVNTANNITIDIFILHMDAENSDGDIATRETQLRELRNAVLSTDSLRPKIIMGDTNCKYTSDRLKEILIDGINNTGIFYIQDAWVRCNRNHMYPNYGDNVLDPNEYGYSNGEIVDKVFYINRIKNASATIIAESYSVDTSFINNNGKALSDHFPVVVNFSCQVDGNIDDEIAEANAASIKIVTNTNNNSTQEEEFYSINGSRIQEPIKGVNIIKKNNGTTLKYIKK